MIITGLVRQQRNRRRINLFIDGVYVFPLLEETVVHSGLRNGDEIGPEALDRLKAAAEADHAREKALQILRRRLHSTSELQQKLRAKDYSPAAIRDALNRLQESGILDDEKFARAFVHDFLLRRPAGRIVLMRALRQKGIQRELAQAVLLGMMDGDRELELAVKAVQKVVRRRKSAGPEAERIRESLRITRSLLRKGFNPEIIRQAMRTVLGAHHHEFEGGN